MFIVTNTTCVCIVFRAERDCRSDVVCVYKCAFKSKKILYHTYIQKVKESANRVASLNLWGRLSLLEASPEGASDPKSKPKNPLVTHITEG